MHLTSFDIDLHRDSEQPLFVQLSDRIRSRIANGQIGPHHRLPASRPLAQHLGISRSTVVSAYEQLVAEGYLDNRRGAGFYVREVSEVPLTTTRQRPPTADIVNEARAAFSHPGYPDPRLFPVKAWARCLARSARVSPEAMISSASRFGDIRLRAAIARYLADWRGLDVSASQVLITAGSVDALEICIRTLAQAGERVGLENPCYQPLRHIAENLGLGVEWLAVGAEGAELPRGKPKMVILTPSHQFPMGGAMPVNRRFEFLQWAAGHQTWIIEDDYDSEFRYSGRPIPALASLDAAGRTIYIGTFSKAFSVNLRLGYLIMPEPQISAFETTLSRFGVKAALPCQRAMANFIDDGDFYRHIRRVRRIYAERRRILLEQIQHKLAPRVEYSDHQAGMQVTIKLASGINDREIADQAGAHGIHLPPLSAYYGQPPAGSGLLLGFCPYTEAEICHNIDVLSDILGACDPSATGNT